MSITQDPSPQHGHLHHSTAQHRNRNEQQQQAALEAAAAAASSGTPSKQHLKPAQPAHSLPRLWSRRLHLFALHCIAPALCRIVSQSPASQSVSQSRLSTSLFSDRYTLAARQSYPIIPALPFSTTLSHFPHSRHHHTYLASTQSPYRNTTSALLLATISLPPSLLSSSLTLTAAVK